MIIPKAKPISAGRFLVNEFLEPLGITQTELADAMKVSRRLVNEICNDRRPVTLDAAERLGVALGTGTSFWVRMQLLNDLWKAENAPDRAARLRDVRVLHSADAAQ